MNEYEATVLRSRYVTFSVEADSPEEAEKIAKAVCKTVGAPWDAGTTEWETEVTEVVELVA